ncbi:hypothetical protein [Cyclobacterium plantarum]|nr:hypothetical protein [Cyclobacterium plantarum]
MPTNKNMGAGNFFFFGVMPEPEISNRDWVLTGSTGFDEFPVNG